MGENVANPGLRAVARREWARLRADRWDWWMLTWIPLLAYAMTWWIFSAGVAREVPIALVDRDGTTLSRSLSRMLDEAPGVAVIAVANAGDATRLLREGRAFGLLLIPAGLERSLQTGRSATVPWFYNAQFEAHAGALTRDVRTVVTTFSAGVSLTASEKHGASPQQARQLLEPIQPLLATLFNESGSYEPFLTMAVLPALLQIFVAVAAAVAVGRELRAGSVPQWLDAAGGSWLVAVTGKLAIPAACFLLHALLFIAFFGGVRGWRVEGSAVMLLAGMVLLILAYLAAGTLLVAATLATREALSLCAFYTAPAFAFAGQSFPLLAMPPIALFWAEALPLTHYLQLQSRYWLEGAPWPYGVPQLLVLAGFTLGFGTLALLLLKLRALSPTSWGRT